MNGINTAVSIRIDYAIFVGDLSFIVFSSPSLYTIFGGVFGV